MADESKEVVWPLSPVPCFPLSSPSKKAKPSDVYLLLFYLTLHCFRMDIVSLFRTLNLNRVIIPLEVIERKASEMLNGAIRAIV